MQKDSTMNQNGADVPSTLLLDRSAIQLSSEDWWSFDTAKHRIFFERCCGCGLIHKTHIRIEGTRIHLRHERLDGDPPHEAVDQSSVIVSNTRHDDLATRNNKKG